MAGRLAIAALALTCGLGGTAQETPPVAVSQSAEHAKEAAKTPKGTVTGTVYCADTNAPARLATVRLVQVGGSARQAPEFYTQAQTDLEGRFTMSKVPEGTYYILVELPGYLKSLPLQREVELKPLTEEDVKHFAPDVPKVTVASKQAATVSIRLERGAEIEGTALFDDGSPAVGLRVALMPKSSVADPKQPEQRFASLFDYAETYRRETDDHGRFRILGLGPGEYVVGVELPANSADNPSDDVFSRVFMISPIGSLQVYYGDTLRASKAKAIKIEAGDSTKDADITIPLSKLHSIYGHVIFKSTGAAPPTAALELLYADNREVARFALATNGEFAIAYIGEDSYILRAAGMNERMPSFEDAEDGDLGSAVGVGFFQPASGISGIRLSGSDSDKDFPGAELPVVVAGDVSGITLSVPDPPTAKTGAVPANPSAPSQQP